MGFGNSKFTKNAFRRTRCNRSRDSRSIRAPCGGLFGKLEFASRLINAEDQDGVGAHLRREEAAAGYIHFDFAGAGTADGFDLRYGDTAVAAIAGMGGFAAWMDEDMGPMDSIDFHSLVQSRQGVSFFGSNSRHRKRRSSPGAYAR